MVMEKMNELKIDMNGGVSLATFVPNSNDLIHWYINPNHVDGPVTMYLPYFDNLIFNDFNKARETGEEILPIVYSFEDKNEYFTYAFENSEFRIVPDEYQKWVLEQPYFGYSVAIQKHSAIFFNDYTGKQFSEEENDILIRFAKVFDQSYIRFLDLQKAEAQAREAKIEASLERVRARSMAMHKSEELKEVIQVIYEQFTDLDLFIEHTGFIVDYKKRNDMHIWLADKKGAPSEITIPYFDSPHWNSFIEARKHGSDFFANHLNFEEKNKFYNDLFQFIPDLPEEAKEFYLNCQSLAISTVLLDNVGLYIENFSGTPYTDEENAILMRFGKVFQQTYTRFLDLQKAEAQAREGQIQLALEKVRMVALGLNKSEEMLEVAKALYEQLLELGFSNIRNAIIDINNDDSNETFTDYDYSHEMSGTITQMSYKDDPTLEGQFQKMSTKTDDFFELVLEGKELEDLINMRLKNGEAPDSRLLKTDLLSYNMFSFGNGAIGISNFGLLNIEEKSILSRFRNVFTFAYKRYNDLVQAEYQTREAKIEAALERVRSQSMGMQSSKDLSNVTTAMFEQLRMLGGELYATGIVFCNKHKDHVEQWHSIPGAGMLTPFIVPISLDYIHQYRFDEWKKGTELFSVVIPEDFIEQHFESLFNLPTVKVVLEDFATRNIPMPETPSWEIDYGASFKYGYILVSALKPFEEKDLLPRFAKVFEQTYTRFLDLQKAEEQAREAQIEAAMEKVRARSLAMQKPDELIDVATVLRKEMGSLGVEELETSSIFIFDESKETTDCWYAIKDIRSKDKNLVTDHMTITLNDTWVGREMLKFYKAKEKQTSILMQGENRKEWINYCSEYSEVLQGYYGNNVPERTYHLIKFSNGFMGAASPGNISEESWDLLKRTTSVFSFAYRRFLDLQKAEAQAREAQIESALERVRSKTMAMHNSRDVGITVVTLFDEVLKLGLDKSIRVGIGILEGNEGMETWSAASNPDGIVDLKMGMLDMTIHPMLIGLKKAWKSGKTSYSYDYIGDDVFRYYEALNNEPEYPFQADLDLLPENEYHKSFFYTEGILFSFAPNPISDEASMVLARFASVFGQTYTRYLDLQKAEAQAREAQIEAALERVRARSMAMHKSEELADLSFELVKQVYALGIETWFCAFNIYDDHPKGSLEWGSNTQGTYEEYRTPREGIFLRYYEAGQKGESLLINEIGKDECKGHYDYLCTLPGVGEQLLQMKDAGIPFPTSQIDHAAYFKYGYILFITFDPVPEAHDIFKRFAKVFEQTYTRFLDLQKAEAQARETQIELALEKIRAKVTAMRESTELLEIVVAMRSEFVSLGHEAHYFWHMRYLPEKYEKAMTSGDGTRIGMVMELPRHIHGDIKLLADWERSNEPTVIYSMNVDAALNYIEKMVSLGDFKQVDPNAPTQDDIRAIGGLTFIMARTTHGEIGYSLPGEVNNIPEEDLATLIRFAGVFDLAYRRFEDLQQAEARARDSEQQASLDRVRAEIASMRTTEDLEKITPLIWRELTNLNIKFFRCGVFIIDETEQIVKTYLTTPSGKHLAVLNLPFHSTHLVSQAVKNWQLNKVYKEHWNREQFKAWAKILVEHGHIKNTSQYQGGGKPPDSLSLHFLPFTHGMLYVGSAVPLTEDEIRTSQKLADSFGVAYSRYEDFQKLEAANKRKSIELEEARQLQLSMLPEKLPNLPNLDIAVFMQTATEVGGDYYDFSIGKDGTLTTVIGDATGHGMKAGTVVTITKSLVNSLAQDEDIIETFSKISNVIKGMKFRQLSMCLLMIKIKDDNLLISSAAMPPVYIYRKEKNTVEEIELKGMPLGALKNFPYTLEQTKINSGDVILLLSDGLPELTNHTDELFSYERTICEFQKAGNKNPDEIIEHLKNSASGWNNGNAPDDDVTFVVIKVK